MNYLIIDKRQRVKVESMAEIPTASARITEELEKEGIQYDFIYNNQLEFLFKNGQTQIKANRKDITEYTHIIFRGHSLDNEKEYHYKSYIINYIDHYNFLNPKRKILVQNSKAIKNLPYYNKIALALFCSIHNIPYFNTYYRTDGKYLQDRDMLKEYPLIIKEYTGRNRIVHIDDQEKIKKNIFLLEKDNDYSQEGLKEQDLTNFFLQEFSTNAQDIRIFVKLGKVIAGWKRKASNGFMTVNKGIYEMYNEPIPEIKELAEKVSFLLNADFIAVDFMYIKGKPHIQEISLHPGFKAYETKIPGKPVNIAKDIVTAFRG